MKDEIAFQFPSFQLLPLSSFFVLSFSFSFLLVTNKNRTDDFTEYKKVQLIRRFQDLETERHKHSQEQTW